MREAIKDNAWILKIRSDTVVSVDHIREFFTLGMLLLDVILDEHSEDDIVWKHATNGQYSAASAYKAQFLGMVNSPMEQMVWKAWAPRKVKFFAWLALQDRIWTADRLDKRGWQNCGHCPLCGREQETGAHLFFKCRFTNRLWRLVIDKLSLDHMDPSSWHLEASVKEWWANMTGLGIPNRKAMASLTMLVSWTVWNERNARIFRHKNAPPPILVNNILTDARLWVTAGAKKLGDILVRE